MSTIDERLKHQRAMKGKEPEHRVLVTVRTETNYLLPFKDADLPDPRWDGLTNADLDAYIEHVHRAEVPADILAASEVTILQGPGRGLRSNKYEPFPEGITLAPEDVRRFKEA